MRSKLTLMLVALLSLVTGPTRADVPVDQSTGAIDMTVPTNLGQMTPETAGQTTDLYYFLQSYLHDSPQPAYIKLTLMPGAKYVISKSLTTMSAITIVGDESNPALINASQLWTNPFVKIKEAVSAKPNDKGFYTSIYNVEFKNFIVEKAQGSLFSSNGQKYDIPYMTIDNVVYEATTSVMPLISLFGGGIVENLTMTRSTAFFKSGYLYNGNGSATLAEAGVNSQKFTFSYNTLVGKRGLVHADASESAKRTITVDHNVIIEPDANFVTGLNAGDANCIVQYNAFLFMPGTKNANGDVVFNDISNTEDAKGAAGSIKGNMVWVNINKLAEDLIADRVINLPMGDCPQRDAKIGDPRWLSAKMRVKEADVDDDNDLAKVINEGVKKGYTEFELVQNQYGNARYYLKQPIVADKAISIVAADKNIQIDASQNTGAFILMSKTPGVKANAKNFYEAGKFILKDLNVQGVNSYIYDDNKVAYAFEEFVVDNCVFELTNNKQDIDAPFRFQAGGPVQFALTNSTLYQTGSNGYKYFVKISSGNFPDKAFESFDGPYTWVIENNTFYKTILCGSGQKMEFLNGGRVANNYKKTAVSLQNNIFYECSDASKKDGFLKNLFGGKSSAKDMADFVSIATNYNTYYCNGAIAGLDKYDKGYMLTGNPGFKDAANGDFTLSAYSAQCNEKTGDPRWFAEGGHYNPVTGIETVETEKAEDGAWYTIQGVRVDKPAKGLYIHNGRKVVVK